jgi:hypothetical protein
VILIDVMNAQNYACIQERWLPPILHKLSMSRMGLQEEC